MRLIRFKRRPAPPEAHLPDPIEWEDPDWFEGS